MDEYEYDGTFRLIKFEGKRYLDIYETLSMRLNNHLITVVNGRRIGSVGLGKGGEYN